MRICLVAPKATFLEDPMVHPPLGLWYIWRLLEKMGHAVAYRDLSEDELPLADYDVYFVTGASPQMWELRRIAGILRKHGKRSVLGGSHAMTHKAEDLFELGYDVVVRGEADRVEVLEEVLAAPKGAALAPARPATLDHLEPPCRKAAWRYRASIEDEHGKRHRATTMFTSRGCPMRCAFCESNEIWGRKVRWVPFDTVKREIDEIVDLGFTAIQFYDDIFPLNKERTLRMMEALGRYHRTQGLIWRCFLRTDVIEKCGGRDYLEQMHEAGLREVFAGVESASNRIKQNIRKGTTIEQDTRVMGWCKELGIRFKAAFILGLPGETMDTMEATRKWILENRPDRVGLTAYIPLPGEPITEAVRAGSDEFDIYWDPSEITEQYWMVGGGRKHTVGKVLTGTSALTPDEIAEFRQKLIEEIKDIPATVRDTLAEGDEREDSDENH